MLFCSFATILNAQNRNGITGYGEIHTVGINIDKSSDDVVVYIGSEGGLIINNNIIFGVYLNALSTPLYFDATLLPTEEFDTPSQYSNHEGSIKTSLNNINLGIVTGLNVSPDKTIQFTIKGLIGVSGADFQDVILVKDSNDPSGYNYESYSSAAVGLNLGIDFVLQIKLGSAVKIGLPLGYSF